MEKSQKLSGKNNPNYGNKWNDEQKQHLSNIASGRPAWNKGQAMSEEQKQKLSEVKKGKPNLKLHGRTLSEDTKEKISISVKEYAYNNKEEVQRRAKLAYETKKTNGHDFAFFKNKKHSDSSKKLIVSTVHEHITDELYEILNDKEMFLEEFKKYNSVKDMSIKTLLTEETIYRRIRLYCPELLKNNPIWETVLEKFFIENNIVFERNTRNIIKPKELDFYLPNHNLAIELNGLYWHSEQYLEKDYHYNKYHLCKEKGIRLIQIFEDEWNNNSDSILATLKTILKINQEKIMARKCDIKILSFKEGNNFVKNHHHFGSSKGGCLYIGLIFDNRIVAVTVFKKENLQTDVWVLDRFCTDGSVVTGGFSKILQYFKNNNKWTSIKTFADLRWSEGNLYSKNNFVIDKILKPDYSYLVNNTRSHKFNHRKEKYNQKYNTSQMSETSIMKKENFHKIWDCGKLRFILVNPN